MKRDVIKKFSASNSYLSGSLAPKFLAPSHIAHTGLASAKLVKFRNRIFSIFQKLMILIPIPEKIDFCTVLESIPKSGIYHGNDSDSSKKRNHNTSSIAYVVGRLRLRSERLSPLSLNLSLNSRRDLFRSAAASA